MIFLLRIFNISLFLRPIIIFKLLNMKKTLLLLYLASTAVFAQKKDFDEKELMTGKMPKNLIQTLPVIQRWLDNENVLISQKLTPDTEAKLMVLEISSGKMTEASEEILHPKAKPIRSVINKNNNIFLKSGNDETQLTNDTAEEKNAMFSPDSSYIAYTKDNNLYTYNFKDKKEIQLTTDGTKTTLNGYATWVYWEEIFGRPTRFRAFWWSPDSKKIAYMRFDESKTMMFPLYSSEGQHGFTEETRYPKSGDPNPEAKVGFVSPAGGKTTWAAFDEKAEQYFGCQNGCLMAVV